jgi:DNA-directed RNA polymerase subunit RPC12/RpoP
MSTAYECRTCGTTGEEHFYNSARYQCKSCWNQRTYKSTTDKMAAYMESRGGAKCSQCGYDRCVAALEYHHRDPNEKDPTWNRGWSLPKLKKELDKCDILCANCHREVHAEMRLLMGRS